VIFEFRKKEMGLYSKSSSSFTILKETDGNIVLSSGRLLLPDGTPSAPSLSFSTELDQGFYITTGNKLAYASSGVGKLAFVFSTLQLISSNSLSWGNNDSLGATDLSLFRNAAGDLLLNSGDLTTTSCSLRIPNAITGGDFGVSPTDYEHLVFDWSGNVAQIRTELGGSGSGRGILIEAAGTDISLATSLAIRAQVTANGIISYTDGDYHLGTTSNRWGQLHLSESVRHGTTAGITASVTQTQGNGALTTEVNEVATVANTNDTVTLPTAAVGWRVKIINNGANVLQIFPASGDDLGNGTDNATTLGVGLTVEFTAYDATNWRVTGGGVPVFKSYTFVARDAANGENFQAGFYDYSTTDANLTQASTTVTHGEVNVPYAAHAFAVAGGAGSTDGSDLVLTVSGTSITDAGVRTTADTEVVVAAAASASTDECFETTKKWIGQITYTLTSTGGSTFSFDFNYGFCKYEDFGNRKFTVTDFESVGLANSNEGGIDIQLLYHNDTGWTYAATGFVAGNSEVIGMNTIHSTEQDIDSGEPFAFKRSGLGTEVDGTALEGVLVRVTTSVNNSVSYLDTHIGVAIQ
jgi:hypothetical protein